MNKKIWLVYISIIFHSCNSNKSTTQESNDADTTIHFKIHTQPSTLQNTYSNFNSPKAINKIAEIENEYFNNIETGCSKYFGTVWQEWAINNFAENDSLSEFEHYSQAITAKGETYDSMHCTIYAIKALQAGFGDTFKEIEAYHRQIWNDREYAGWSIGYILTKYYNWKAYLFISNISEEYTRCRKKFTADKTYYVWKQPDIPIEQIFDFDKEQDAIDSLLNLHEFGWGFSYQGIHTWITRFDTLKECNWMGVPCSKYSSPNEKPLFIATKFTEFLDYNSHVIIFPPKKKSFTTNNHN